jgi:glucan 1,3-beta-glucosidase
MENTHQNLTSVFTGRGVLSESQGPVWLIGTASEHAGIYQYSLRNAKNHYMGLIQTETVSPVFCVCASLHSTYYQPYYQPIVGVNPPFLRASAFNDPATLPSSAWGLLVQNSSNIFIFGAGHYSVRTPYFRYNRDHSPSAPVLQELQRHLREQ